MVDSAIAIAAALASPARKAPAFDTHVSTSSDDPDMVVLCDPRAFRFSIQATAGASTVDRSYPRRTVIDPEALIQMLPGWTGTAEIRGPLIRYVRCGPFTIKLEGDAYNSNVQGESGAYSTFLTASVIAGNQRIVEPVRLTECDRSLPRARPCPAGYAVRVDGIYNRITRQLELTRTTASTDSDIDGTRRIATAKSKVDVDLSLWPSVYDD